MNLELAQRQLALAGIALLGGLIALAASPRSSDQNLPEARPAPGGGWYVDPAGAEKRLGSGKTNCGYFLDARSLGVANPTLPCNAKIYIAFRDKRVLTQVIANAPVRTGHQFEFTPALAKEIGLKNTQEIHWRFAGKKKKR